MSDGMSELIEELKKTYDYIILDTPPVGLVSDALELAIFRRYFIYVRQNFSKKEMITLLNNRVKRELDNAVLFLMVLKIRLNMALATASYGYGYGYGPYSNGYTDEEKPHISMMQSRKITQTGKK
jgi:cellulose biosynthesis protein BcsQ